MELSSSRTRSSTKFKSRRTSLNVNLSYVSESNLSFEDDSTNKITIRKNPPAIEADPKRLPLSFNEKLRDVNVSNGNDNITTNENKPLEKNVVNKNIERFCIEQALLNQIKPSYVRLTSTPIPPKYQTLITQEKSQELFAYLECNTPSNALKNVHLTLHSTQRFYGNKPSDASITCETSMDMKELQGAAILNSDNECNNSLNLVQDTNPTESVNEKIDSRIIADSEQDASINTVRTSLNVNTSIDSRISLMQNKNFHISEKERENKFNKDVDTGNQKKTIYTSSESTDENVPMYSTVVTQAVIHCENSLNEMNSKILDDAETVINFETGKHFDILHDMSLHTRILHKNEISSNEKSPANHSMTIKKPNKVSNTVYRKDDKISARQNLPIRNMQGAPSNLDDLNDSSSIDTSSLENQYQRRILPGISNVSKKASDRSSKPISKGKRKLFRERRSEVVDLSPVSDRLVEQKKVILKKHINRRNKTVKKKDMAKKKTTISSDTDAEDTDTYEKKNKKIRRVRAKKMADVNLWKQMNRDESSNDVHSALGGTSLDDFEPKNNSHTQRKNKKKSSEIRIVITGLPVDQKLFVKNTVMSLGSAKLQKIVSQSTTHVISKGIRTTNLLRGIARGCWLVSFEWISKSHEVGKWLDPEKYEIANFSKAVQKNRKDRQLFKSAYISELFLICGLIYVEKNTSIPASVLKELIEISGGRTTTEPEKAKIIIGHGGLKEAWILDSIADGEPPPMEQYFKKKCANQSCSICVHE